MHHDVNNVRLARRLSTVMWSIEGRSSSLIAFPNNLDLKPWFIWMIRWGFDQKCSVNLIMRRVLLRIILLQEPVVDRHHECITIRSYEAVCSIWVDWLYYKWSFSFGLELSFCLVCHKQGSSESQDNIAFFKNLFSDFLIEGFGNSSLIELDLLLGL